MTITSSGSSHELCVWVIGANSTGSPPNVSSVTDNKSGGSSTYTQVGIFQTGTQLLAIYCALNVASGITSTTCTLTATATGFLDCYTVEYTPPAGITVSIDNQTGTDSGNSTSALTAAITPTGTDNLVLAAASAPSVSAVNNSYNLRSNTDGNGVADKLDVGNVSTNVTFTTTSGGWWTLLCDLKGVAAAATSGQSVVGGQSVMGGKSIL